MSDAFHAVGVLPIDVTRDGVDALITGSYKWLLGPHGAGFIYVSDELLNSLSHRCRVGWGLMITK
nr:aminotransferase class V-fold PLP-dependent enzyme [Vulcanisaeta sp. JCM 16159]